MISPGWAVDCRQSYFSRLLEQVFGTTIPERMTSLVMNEAKPEGPQPLA
jgi:hypothetical protein